MHTHLNYVVVVLPASTPTSTALSSSAATNAPSQRQRKLTTDASSLSSGSANGATDPDAARVVLIDMENKMVAYVGLFERGVREVVSAWGSVYVLGNDGTVGPFQSYMDLAANRTLLIGDSLVRETNRHEARPVVRETPLRSRPVVCAHTESRHHRRTSASR